MMFMEFYAACLVSALSDDVRLIVADNEKQ